MLPIVLAITGASGAPYAVRLLELLARNRRPGLADRDQSRVATAQRRVRHRREAGLRAATGGDWSSVTVYPDDDRGAKPASGSVKTAGMVICPCSMGTVAAIAGGTSRSLVERAADVVLKERRKLILVPRETPLSLIHLRNLVSVTEAGARCSRRARFYHRPTQIGELVDFVVQRVIDQLGVEIDFAPRWTGGDG